MEAKERDSGLFILSMCLFFRSSAYCLDIQKITHNQSLSQGNTLVSPSRVFELGFFTPSQSPNRYVGVRYKRIRPRPVVWVANRDSPLRVTDSRASINIRGDGNLEILDGGNHSVWSTNVQAPSNSSVAVLLDDGNLVIRDCVSGDRIWQSFDHSVNVFLPGSKFGYNDRTGHKYRLNSWKSEDDPSPGDFVVELSPEKPPEALLLRNGRTVWRSGPWDKTMYTGIPEMYKFYESPYDIVQDAEKGTTLLNFHSYGKACQRYFVVTSKGVIKLMQSDKGGEFYTYWETPKSPCDIYGACGPFGVCKNYNSPVCECLKGFVPKSSEAWRKGNWEHGCVRRKELLCNRNTSSRSSTKCKTDGFLKICKMKPPDFYEVVEVRYLTADGCREVCLGNCSCVAYAYIQGIGCLVWSQGGLIDLQGFSYGGVEIFVRLAHEELAAHRRMKIIIGSVSIFACGTLVAAVFGLLRRRDARNEKEKRFELAEASESARNNLRILREHNPMELPVFDFSSISAATNHFSQTNKLGQGGFGSVYKGTMPDGKEIAVKRLSSSSGQGLLEFKNEMVLISRLQHRNLVRLLGYCAEDEEKLLIYEYMPNTSLDNFIFDSRRSAQLDWPTRMNIVLGVSRGLVYLHRDSCLRVIHRDLKLSNILLDEKMNPRISDFGLARMFQGTMDLTNTRRVVGTLGYMSPEYAIAGMFSEKSDVFSFGVLLLEILSGVKNTTFYDYESHLTLIAYTWKLWSENRGLNVVDKALEGSFSPAEAMRCLNVALLCVQDNSVDRPTMTDVVSMLSNETDRPEPKQPLFSFQISTVCDAQNQAGGKSSLNEVTNSLTEGR